MAYFLVARLFLSHMQLLWAQVILLSSFHMSCFGAEGKEQPLYRARCSQGRERTEAQGGWEVQSQTTPVLMLWQVHLHSVAKAGHMA